MEFPELHVQIFPNPVVEYIHIKTSNYETIRSINIFDLNGRCMYSDNYSSPKTIQPIGLNQLSPGVYLVQVIDQYQNTQTVKITKTSIPK